MRCHIDLNGKFVPCKEVSDIKGRMTPGGWNAITPVQFLEEFRYCPFCGTYLETYIGQVIGDNVR
jgi:hypothetical protein